MDTEPVNVRLSRDLLSKIDAIRATKSPSPSRPEAIRQILDASFRPLISNGAIWRALGSSDD